ncbi:MAG: ribosomal L7Ae/L30e/S12e/Gadd45 family protein [Clostridia bacterium]|nr:ribosomal L7Ae/L30e/S12e/Gadd45 family protein [Clostridia bacterium]
MKNKILSLLGFATKAGKLGFGFEAAREALRDKKSKLILIASDISEKSLKEMKFYSEKANVRCIELKDLTMIDISNSVGRKCGIISVNDNGFADALQKAYDI